MTDYLIRACDYLGIEPGQAINPRIEDGAYVLIVDRGIEGSPKYHIPLSELDGGKQAAIVFDDLGVYDLSYRELQARAKELGIPANQGRDELIAALWPAEDEEE